MGLLNEYIEVSKELNDGAPVFKGTHVKVKILFDYLEEKSIDEFLEAFPVVSREQAEAVIELAAKKFIAGLAV